MSLYISVYQTVTHMYPACIYTRTHLHRKYEFQSINVRFHPLLQHKDLRFSSAAIFHHSVDIFCVCHDLFAMSVSIALCHFLLSSFPHFSISAKRENAFSNTFLNILRFHSVFIIHKLKNCIKNRWMQAF